VQALDQDALRFLAAGVADDPAHGRSSLNLGPSPALPPGPRSVPQPAPAQQDGSAGPGAPLDFGGGRRAASFYGTGDRAAGHCLAAQPDFPAAPDSTGRQSSAQRGARALLGRPPARGETCSPRRRPSSGTPRAPRRPPETTRPANNQR